MKRHILIFAITGIIILILSDCKKDKHEDTGLEKITWVLDHVLENRTLKEQDFPTDAARNIIVEFTDSSGVLLFTGICNNGKGKYTLASRGNVISISDLKTTLVACPYVIWENYTVSSLLSATNYEITADTLLINSSGDYDLYFRKE